jgi:hypothetical protein
MNNAIVAAEKYIEEGKGKWFVHFIGDDYTGESGISSPISEEELSKGGYISDYFRVYDIPNPAFWK